MRRFVSFIFSADLCCLIPRFPMGRSVLFLVLMVSLTNGVCQDQNLKLEFSELDFSNAERAVENFFKMLSLMNDRSIAHPKQVDCIKFWEEEGGEFIGARVDYISENRGRERENRETPSSNPDDSNGLAEGEQREILFLKCHYHDHGTVMDCHLRGTPKGEGPWSDSSCIRDHNNSPAIENGEPKSRTSNLEDLYGP